MANAHFLICKWPLLFLVILGLTEVYYFFRASSWKSPEISNHGGMTTLVPRLLNADLGVPLVLKLNDRLAQASSNYDKPHNDNDDDGVDDDGDSSNDDEGSREIKNKQTSTVDLSKYLLNQKRLPQVEEVLLENKKVKDGSFPNEFSIRNIFQYEDVDFFKYMLNATAAQQLRVDLPVGKVVPRKCLNVTYPSFKHMKVSIIIPFHNELWAVLLRCVQGILRRSPFEALQEIILIDDKSEHDNLKGPLVQYLSQVPKARLLRTERREGLIRARMAAARKAKGDVLVFLDAHVEVATGWLEPLLDVIRKNKKAIAIPTVDHITPKTLKYNPVYYRTRGSFGWELDYVWKDENNDIYFDQDVEPFKSGTMIGCAFAVDRQAFFDLGGYDENMMVWGGENLEISFRTWMCGGSMMVVPCSHIGHIYRAILPYNFSQAILFQNLQKVADVWMDDYKYIYYRTSGHEFIFNEADTQALQLRSQLRKDLKCKDFKWFLENITPEVVVPKEDAIFFGQLRNLQSRFCLSVNESSGSLYFDYCTSYDRNQIFSFTKSSSLMHGNVCLLPSEINDSVELAECDTTSRIRWTYDYLLSPSNDFTQKLVGVDKRKSYGTLISKHTGSCLGKDDHYRNSTLSMQTCDQENPLQYWIFMHKLNERR